MDEDDEDEDEAPAYTQDVIYEDIFQNDESISYPSEVGRCSRSIHSDSNDDHESVVSMDLVMMILILMTSTRCTSMLYS